MECRVTDRNRSLFWHDRLDTLHADSPWTTAADQVVHYSEHLPPWQPSLLALKCRAAAPYCRAIQYSLGIVGQSLISAQASKPGAYEISSSLMQEALRCTATSAHVSIFCGVTDRTPELSGNWQTVHSLYCTSEQPKPLLESRCLMAVPTTKLSHLQLFRVASCRINRCCRCRGGAAATRNRLFMSSVRGWIRA